MELMDAFEGFEKWLRAEVPKYRAFSAESRQFVTDMATKSSDDLYVKRNEKKVQNEIGNERNPIGARVALFGFYSAYLYTIDHSMSALPFPSLPFTSLPFPSLPSLPIHSTVVLFRHL